MYSIFSIKSNDLLVKSGLFKNAYKCISQGNISAHLRNVIDENCLHVNRGGTRVLHGVVCRWISGRWNAIHAAPCFHVCWGVCLYVICMFAPVFVDVHKTGAAV